MQSMMRSGLLLILAAAAVPAASIHGTVMEAQTGKPLAHTVVTLDPVAGTEAKTQSVRTNIDGVFDFSGLPAGAYGITASRRGFAPVRYGQMRWNGAGMPAVVAAGDSKTLSLRLPRYGAISGAVLDENDVGLPEHDVVAYRATRPPKLVARARSDDRGRYHIFGLEPGKYWVRTVAAQYDEGGYLPTFYRETPRVEDAAAVEVELDQQADDINIHPAPGRLISVGGRVAPPARADVTLVSDAGAETLASDASGRFQFHPVAPGSYEIYAQSPPDPRTGEVRAAYQPVLFNRDRDDLRLELRALPQVQFVFKDTQGQPVDWHRVRVMARREDLSGAGRTQTFELGADSVAFLPGRWDLAVLPAHGYFVAEFLGPRAPGAGRPDGWNQVPLTSGSPVLQYVLSSAPGAIHGTVTGANQQPVPGAPVYLEAYDPASHRRLRDPQLTHTDTRGRYRFEDLAPGDYLLLSSFDADSPEAAGSQSLHVPQSRDVAQDLVLSETH